MQPNISLGARHHHTTLRVENNQSRRRPTSWSLSKLPVSDLYWKLFARGSTFLLDQPRTVGPIARKTREKVVLLSLIFLFLSLFPFLSPFLPSSQIVWSKVKFGEYFLPHVNIPLAPWITLITLSIYLGFLSNHVLPHVSYRSHLSSCLASSTLDTCLILSHSKAQSVPHYSWCLKKCEIPTVLEFDEIRYGSEISRDDSNGEVHFVIQDLENFWILTEITVLLFFGKFEFSRVLQTWFNQPCLYQQLREHLSTIR